MRLPTGNGRRASGSRRKRSSPLCSKSASCSHDGKPPHTQKFRQFPDRQEPSEARTTKTTRLKEKIAKLKEEVKRLHGLKTLMLATPDQQISLTDPDSRSMATSGRGSGVVGYNVQVAVDTEHHLIVTHEVTNVGSDRAQLAHMAKQTKTTLEAANLDVVADRG